MISSAYRSDFIVNNAEGDHRTSGRIRSAKATLNIDSVKRFKSSVETAEEFFYRSHPFSDLVLLIDDKELFVDKSVLAAASKVFQSYFNDENIDTIELLDVSAEDMIELLRFVYPQFECTITKENVTILLILAHRFEFEFIGTACRTFLLLFLSKLRFINEELIEQDDGTRVFISSMIDFVFIWFKEFADVNDSIVCENLLKIFAQCSTKRLTKENFDEKLQAEIFRSRAKYLEDELK